MIITVVHTYEDRRKAHEHTDLLCVHLTVLDPHLYTLQYYSKMPHREIHMAMCGGKECLRELSPAHVRNSVCKLHVHHFIYTIWKF